MHIKYVYTYIRVEKEREKEEYEYSLVEEVLKTNPTSRAFLLEIFVRAKQRKISLI